MKQPDQRNKSLRVRPARWLRKPFGSKALDDTIFLNLSADDAYGLPIGCFVTAMDPLLKSGFTFHASTEK